MGRDEIELFSAQVDGVTTEDEIVYLNVEGCINCAGLVFGFMSKAYNVALEQFPKKTLTSHSKGQITAGYLRLRRLFKPTIICLLMGRYMA
jgi:hypothetical protein